MAQQSPTGALPVTASAQPIGRLRTQHLLLMIVAAAAPLGVAIGNLPTGLILGNGIGLPAAFLAAALVIFCLVTGFMRLARDVRTEGGFADLVRAGLGPGSGLGAAYVTGMAYWAGALALAAATGYFGNLIGTSHGVTLPWWAYSLTAFALVAFLGRARCRSGSPPSTPASSRPPARPPCSPGSAPRCSWSSPSPGPTRTSGSPPR
ncbi:hypothetical protein LO762_29750 [Actinocorallia sp. API 0066]|uniref:hypothetical protein n=1 Tax=Actinocorallia sp. API 0066 TaxID=2896846 RepID=UPI001E4569A8|nr:hypothetical protein [Actinocorallia sp. API 0066]MCD0453334.1 hypothetical protein [Actinocorallia sp. API 0066]